MNQRILIAGDASGGLRFWKAHRNNDTLQFVHAGLLQLVPVVNTDQNPSPTSPCCSVVCMETLSDGRFAVSTDAVASNNQTQRLVGAMRVPVQASRGGYVFNATELLAKMTIGGTMATTTGGRIVPSTCLLGHAEDAVICMCETPDGALFTGGGKLDATLQMWSRSQIIGHTHHGRNGEETQDSIAEKEKTNVQSNALKTLSGDLGYVFALTVLPDAKDGSNYYAVAAARYNTVRIII